MQTTEHRALVVLGRWLAEQRYRFETPTPASHQRVNARPEHAETRSIRGAVGWSRRFRAGVLPELERLLEAGGMLLRDGTWCRSAVRFSTVAPEVSEIACGPAEPATLIMHAAYPTLDPASVFFGPDTYRFISALRRTVRPARRLVDVGAGSGAGGLAIADLAERVVLADINPHALRFARINAELAGASRVELVESDVLAGVAGEVDAVIANPPYLADRHHRTYRDGGGALGIELSLRIAREALARLAPGGQLVLYTGSPVIDGHHPLREALAPILAARRCRTRWSELDPDVFGEELDAPPYDRVDRIAVVLLSVDVA